MKYKSEDVNVTISCRCVGNIYKSRKQYYKRLLILKDQKSILANCRNICTIQGIKKYLPEEGELTCQKIFQKCLQIASEHLKNETHSPRAKFAALLLTGCLFNLHWKRKKKKQQQKKQNHFPEYQVKNILF